MIFYFPNISGKETLPNQQEIIEIDLDDDSDDAEDTTKAKPSKAADQRTAAGRAKIDSHVLDVYWQDRLVPDSHFNQLPFFPKLVKAETRANAGEFGVFLSHACRTFGVCCPLVLFSTFAICFI